MSDAAPAESSTQSRDKSVVPTRPGRNGGTLQSGGPRNGGRPLGSISLTERLKKKLNENGGALADQVIQTAVEMVLDKDPAALKLVFDRHDGLLTQKLTLMLDSDQQATLATAFTAIRAVLAAHEGETLVLSEIWPEVVEGARTALSGHSGALDAEASEVLDGEIVGDVS